MKLKANKLLEKTQTGKVGTERNYAYIIQIQKYTTTLFKCQLSMYYLVNI